MFHHNFYGQNMQHGFNANSIPNLHFWFKANQLAGSDGSAVTSMPDASGNGRNLTQASGTRQAVLKLAVQNGLNVLDFDGSDDYYATSGTNAELDDLINLGTGNAGKYTLFFVVKVRTIVGSTSGTHYADREIWTDGGGPNALGTDGGDMGLTLQNSGGTKIANGLHPQDVSTCRTSLTLSQFVIITMRGNGTTRFIRQNADTEVSGGTATPSDRVTNPNWLIGGNYDATLCADMQIGEVIFYNRDLNSTELDTVRNALNAKWMVY